MSNILDKIFADKKKELRDTQRKTPLSEIKQRISDQQPTLDVYKALEKNSTSRIIAEIKPKTPFKNLLLTGQDIATAGVGGALVAGVLTASTILKKNIIKEIAMNSNS